MQGGVILYVAYVSGSAHTHQVGNSDKLKYQWQKTYGIAQNINKNLLGF